MSGTPNPNLYNAIAVSLANPPVLSDEQQVFQEALEEAKKSKEHNGKVPVAFNHFINAKDADEVKEVMDRARAQNSLWKQHEEKSLLKRFERISTKTLQFKGLIDPLVAINSKVASPLWGTIAFLLGFFKELSSTEELLNRTFDRIKTSLERFKEYYPTNGKVQKSLRSALKSYYQCIVEYAVDLQQFLAKKVLVSVISAFQGSVKEIVTKFETDVKYRVENVDWGASARHYEQSQERNDLQHQILLNAITTHGSNQASTSNTSSAKVVGLPQMLSPNFTGRQKDLTAIRASLTRRPGEQTQTAIYGIGGVGKTQVLLKYANAHHPRPAKPTSYDYICFLKGHSPDAIRQSVVEVVQAFGIERTIGRTSGDDPIQDFKNWLHQHENWLLLIDDVQKMDHVMSVLPTGDRGHILISTRREQLASMVTTGGSPIEILPMNISTATLLAHQWALRSQFDQDKTISTAEDVAKFARGLPLVVEQIVKSSHEAKPPRTINSTLELMQNKQFVLEQKDPDAFEGHKSSIGAVIQQTMIDLRAQDPPAETLFRILIFGETSSIPIDMLCRGVNKFPAYINRKLLFDRGRVEHIGGTTVDVIDSAILSQNKPQPDAEPQQPRRRGNFARRVFKRPEASNNLSVTNDTFDDILRRAFQDGTPLARLFSHEAHLHDAIKRLEQLALIRKVGTNTVWIHDLFAEVTQALVEIEAGENNLSGFDGAIMASTLVYLAFPVPIRQNTSMDRFEICPQYLPHAVACHRHLQTMRILNGSSVGAELSHVIASTIAKRPWIAYDRASIVDDFRLAEIDRDRAKAILYYRSAMLGYVTCHKGVLAASSRSLEQILLDIRTERQSKALEDMSPSDFIEDNQRFGSIPLWRAFQTMVRLAKLLQCQPDPDDIEEAIQLLKLSLRLFERAFGRNHKDTQYVRGMLIEVLFRTERFEEARLAAVKGFESVLDWNEDAGMCLGTEVYENNILWSRDALAYCDWALRCCLRLPGQAKGKEAVIYAKTILKAAQETEGEEHFSHMTTIQRLAMAFEQSGQKMASLYWWGRLVFCALTVLAWEGFDPPDSGTPWVGALLRSEDSLTEAVSLYEAARERIGRLEEEETSLVLRKFLAGVDMRIKLWRADRIRHGSPYREVVTVTTEEELAQIPCPWQEMNKKRRMQEEEARKWLEQQPKDEYNPEQGLEEISQVHVAEESSPVSLEEQEKTAASSESSMHEDTDTIDEAIFPVLPPLRLPVMFSEEQKTPVQEIHTHVLEIAS